MVPETSVLILRVVLVDRIPLPPPKRRRGRPVIYGLFLKVVVIMIVRRLPKVGSLLAVLEQPTPEMQRRVDVVAQDKLSVLLGQLHIDEAFGRVPALDRRQTLDDIVALLVLALVQFGTDPHGR